MLVTSNDSPATVHLLVFTGCLLDAKHLTYSVLFTSQNKSEEGTDRLTL